MSPPKNKTKWEKCENEEIIFAKIDNFFLVVSMADGEWELFNGEYESDIIKSGKCKRLVDGKMRALNALTEYLSKVEDKIEKLWPHA